MVNTLGFPTIFFTHSAADLQWPQLAQLISPDYPNSRSACANAVIKNPALTDWFFYCRVMEFIKAFYIGVLGVTDYWLRLEWQHRGSPHVHGLAWLPDTPDVQQLGNDCSDTLKEEIIKHADSLVSTLLSFLMVAIFLMHQLRRLILPHVCSISYQDIQDIDQDLAGSCSHLSILAVQPPTASVLSMANRSAALATTSLFSPTQPLSQRMSQLSSHLGMMR